MLSQTLYPGERSVFAAGMVDSNRSRLGEDGLKIKPAGHVVTRVYPGGEKFQIFVLNDRNEAYEILYKTGEIKSHYLLFPIYRLHVRQSMTETL